MKELTGLCKNCIGCNKLEIPEFEGVEKCKFCTLEQLTIEQMKMEGLDDNKDSNVMQKQKKQSTNSNKSENQKTNSNSK